MFRLIPFDTNYDILRWRLPSLAIALALMVAALVLIPMKGFNFALDFTGGTVAELKFEKEPDLERVRAALEGAGYSNPVVQTFGAANDIVYFTGTATITWPIKPFVDHRKPLWQPAVCHVCATAAAVVISVWQARH